MGKVGGEASAWWRDVGLFAALHLATAALFLGWGEGSVAFFGLPLDDGRGDLRDSVVQVRRDTRSSA